MAWHGDIQEGNSHGSKKHGPSLELNIFSVTVCSVLHVLTSECVCVCVMSIDEVF